MSKEAILGLFVMIVFGVFFYFTINMGSFFLNRSFDTYTIYFRGVGTLDEGAPVKQAGYDVGEVAEISPITIYSPTQEHYVVVKVKVSEDAIISKDSIASIQTQGMMGEKYIEIGYGSGEKAIPVTQENDPPPTKIHGQGPQELDRVIQSATELSDQVKETLESFNTIFGDKELQRNIIHLIANLEIFSENLNRMIGGQQERLDRIMSNVEIASAHLNSLMATAELFVEEGRGLLADNRQQIKETIVFARKTFDNASALSEEMRQNVGGDIKDMSAQLKSFSVNLNDSIKRANNLIAKLDNTVNKNTPHIDQTFSNIREVSEKAKSASTRIDEILKQFQEGEGLAHQLIYDTEFAHDTKSTVKETSKMVSGLSGLPERFSIVTELRYFDDQPRFDSDDNQIRADLGIEYKMSDDLYVFAGGNNLGSSNDLEAQVGYRLGAFSLHGGIIESEVGAGVDWQLFDRFLIGIQGLGFTHKDKERLDAFSEIRIWDGLSLVGGVQDITDEQYPNIGIKMRF